MNIKTKKLLALGRIGGYPSYRDVFNTLNFRFQDRFTFDTLLLNEDLLLTSGDVLGMRHYGIFVDCDHTTLIEISYTASYRDIQYIKCTSCESIWYEEEDLFRSLIRNRERMICYNRGK